jgi:hypothetical protein
VYDAHFVHTLCEFIALERDPTKFQELIDLFRAVIRGNQEEISRRMDSLREKYALTLGHSTLAE